MTTENLHPLQKFEIINLHRSKINKAPYNPRVIDDENRRRLGKNLEKRGLLDTLVWNEVTGNLVSGHQRLDKLDAWYEKKHGNLDYEITVAKVSLELKDEIEQNIFFNNARAMGVFDDTLMIELLKSTELPEIDYKTAGMSDDDISYYGITSDIGSINSEDIDNVINGFENVKEEAKGEVDEEEKKRRKEHVKIIKGEQTSNDVDTYVTLTFSTQKAKQDFMQSLGEVPESLYIKGEMFVEKYFTKE